MLNSTIKLPNWAKGIIFYCLIYLAIIAYIGLTKLLIIHSGIQFDFENLLNLKLLSLGGILGLLLSLLFLFYISYWSTKRIFKLGFGFYQRFLISLCSIIFFIPFFLAFDWQIPHLALILSAISYILIADIFMIRKEPNLIWIMSWMIILSSFSSFLFFNYYLKYDVNNRLDYAQNLIKKSDPRIIMELDLFQNNISSDTVFTNLLSVPFPFKIHKEEFSAVLNKSIEPLNIIEKEHDFIINVFDKYGNSMVYNQYTTYEYYQNLILKSKKITPHLYFNEESGTYLLKRSFVNVSHPGSPFTTFFELIQKNSASNPEPLLKYTYQKSLNAPNYSIYKDKLLYSSNIRSFAVNQSYEHELNESQYLTYNQENYSYLDLKTDNNTIVSLRRESTRIIKPISLFSLVFTLLGVLLLILTIINSYKEFIPSNFGLKFRSERSFSRRIQLSLIALVLTSFVIIGAVTLYYFKFLSDKYNRDLVNEKILAISTDVLSRINPTQNEKSVLASIETSIFAISNKHQIDINFYDKKGAIINSSVPKLFEFGFVADRIDSITLKSIFNNFPSTFISEHKLSDLKFESVFIPITDSDLNPFGYIQIPYASQMKTQNNVTDFVGTLLNVYVFLFLFAGALALAIGRSFTRPLILLGEKMKKFKLNKKNEIIEWSQQDELGELISNYNDMVQKMEESALFLAKSERDMAWREMAKQVAHEIQNPLTPMKLSIQFLEKASKQDSTDVKKLIQRVSNTLLEQINNLSQIASEFSNFAKMPKASNEKIILNEIVEGVHDLFRKREDMEIKMYDPLNDLYVFADRNHLLRILNNILKNAIQAIPSDRKGKIQMRLYKKDEYAVVKISDNGIGIPEEMKAKIFTPNFTTKSSGTGLGLAISANMIESFNGRIYFDTEYGKGTDFYIEIPLMHLDDNFKHDNRVSLDD